MERAKKIPNVIKLIKEKALKGDFLLLPHAIERKFQRKIDIPDIAFVLSNGWHEKKKDEYKPEFDEWNYSIRGETVEGRQLRIAVTFDPENKMLIITVINIGARPKK